MADELLDRSVKEGVEQLLRDGAIVATPARGDIPPPAPALTGQWQDLLDALGDDRHADARALLDPSKVDSEVDDPPVAWVKSDQLEADDHSPPPVW
ncbi:MAG: hypothetical protein V4696_11540 [Pseudomonadota bacterium]